MRSPSTTCSIALCVSEPTILCVDVSTASAPCDAALGRQVGMEAEVRPPRLVDDERHARRVADLGAARDVGDHAVVRRRDDEHGARVRRLARSAAATDVGRDAVGHAELDVVLGRDERRDAAAEHEPVDDRGVRVALRDDPRAERREREAHRVVALRRAVREEPRARDAVGLGGEQLRALVRRRRRADVDALDVLADVERQRAVAEREAQARGRRRRRPCGRGRGSGPGPRNA